MSNDWVEHNGGPQPVADDVWVGIVTSPCLNWWDIETMPAKEVGWGQKFEWSVLNDHLINAARLEGIRLGLEAAKRHAEAITALQSGRLVAIPSLDPETIAKEAQND